MLLAKTFFFKKTRAMWRKPKTKVWKHVFVQLRFGNMFFCLVKVCLLFMIYTLYVTICN